ncbi:MAG: tetratricopeptide repeat protein [Polyangiales bacterium]
MSDDFLERATRALKDTGEPPPADVVRTRLRVMEDLRVERKKRARIFYVVVPIAAVLACATAWAAQTGRLAALVRGLKGTPSEVTAPTPTPIAPRPSAIATVTPSATPEPAAIEPAPSASAPVVAVAPPPVAPSMPAAKTSVSAAPSATAVAEESDAGSADLAAYKLAHKLHFSDQNYASAIGAWENYLHDFPGGAFAVEARYNRAICLVKLGRNAEAKTALAPFAEGKVAGGYRQEQAKALLDVLDGKSP